MIKSFFISLVTVLASAANVQYTSEATLTVTSPNTLKTYLFYNTRSNTPFSTAQTHCPSNSKLASISSESGDVDFLGQFIESLDHPYWIDGSQFNTPMPCVALYAGGAIAIPKPSKSNQSPCDTRMNFICEIKGDL